MELDLKCLNTTEVITDNNDDDNHDDIHRCRMYGILDQLSCVRQRFDLLVTLNTIEIKTSHEKECLLLGITHCGTTAMTIITTTISVTKTRLMRK